MPVLSAQLYVYIGYFCPSYMITMNDIDVIVSISVSPVEIKGLILLNSKSLQTFVNRTVLYDFLVAVKAEPHECVIRTGQT